MSLSLVDIVISEPENIFLLSSEQTVDSAVVVEVILCRWRRRLMLSSKGAK